MRTELKLTGLDGVLDLLRKLPPEVVSKNGGPVRAALRKGAVLIQKQAKSNLQSITNNATSAGAVLSTGFLLKNVVVSRGKAPSSGKGERMLVRVSRKTYLGRSTKSKPVTTLQTANLLEYGSSKQNAEPWLRPAFASTAEKAITTIESELVKRLNAIVKKLSK